MNSMSGKQLANLLQGNGWILFKVQGSHNIYGKRGITVRICVPIHGNKSLKIGLLKHLLKMAGLAEASTQGDGTSETLTTEDVASSDATDQEID